mmetsp:Transcript_91334/g.284110  ORF Transcript_91334/g.284110 Transcript_91334/m.284110 type:complete len:254 (-) Transcript_91334:346-1107(-)
MQKPAIRLLIHTLFPLTLWVWFLCHWQSFHCVGWKTCGRGNLHWFFLQEAGAFAHGAENISQQHFGLWRHHAFHLFLRMPVSEMQFQAVGGVTDLRAGPFWHPELDESCSPTLFALSEFHDEVKHSQVVLFDLQFVRLLSIGNHKIFFLGADCGVSSSYFFAIPIPSRSCCRLLTFEHGEISRQCADVSFYLTQVSLISLAELDALNGELVELAPCLDHHLVEVLAALCQGSLVKVASFVFSRCCQSNERCNI